MKPRFLVFTGTSGKTMARGLVAHALSKLGYEVISPKSGYTNELGIVLAALGITHISLRSIRGWYAIITNPPKQNQFVCIELGADFYKDIPWFLKRFIPYAVFLTDMDTSSWARPVADLIQERMQLVDALPVDGYLVFSPKNIQAEKIVALSKFSGTAIRCEETSHNTYVFEPQRKAADLVNSFLGHIHDSKSIPTDLFLDYTFGEQRLYIEKAQRGFSIVNDIYKAVPYCVRWFLKMASAMQADKKILVFSEMRPYIKNEESTYREIGKLLQSFDRVYFMGTQKQYKLLREGYSSIVSIQSIQDFPKVGRDISQCLQEGDMLFLKGAFIYQLDKLKEYL